MVALSWQISFIEKIINTGSNSYLFPLSDVKLIIKMNKFPRNESLKLLDQLVKHFFLIKRFSSSSSKGGRPRIFYRLSPSKQYECNYCSQKNTLIVHCVICGVKYCGNHIINLNNIYYCIPCIINSFLCPYCSESSEKIDGSNFQILLPLGDNYFTCLNQSCTFYKNQIPLSQIEDEWDLINSQILINNQNDFSIQQFPLGFHNPVKDSILNRSFNLTLAMSKSRCNNCGQNNDLIFEKKILKTLIRQFGPDYRYQWECKTHCFNCNTEINVLRIFSWYHGHEYLLLDSYGKYSGQSYYKLRPHIYSRIHNHNDPTLFEDIFFFLNEKEN